MKFIYFEWVPQRYTLGVMGFLGVANAYIMRACLSLAIVQMVKAPAVENTTIVDPESCPYSADQLNQTSSSKDLNLGVAVCIESVVQSASSVVRSKSLLYLSMRWVFYLSGSKALANSTRNTASDDGNQSKSGGYGEYDWDETLQGAILSAFYYGYLLTHIPGGLLSQRYGGKQTMGLGILSTALFTLLTPLVAPLGAIPLCLLRFFMGLGEIGTVLSTFLSGFILEYLGWRAVFYIWGTVGVLWFVFWSVLCYNDPSSHPFISIEEKKYLLEAIGSTERKDVGCTPWVSILRSAPVWALVIAEIGHDFGLYTMVTDLPKYMGDVMHFKISENGVLSALPYLVMWFVSLLLGYVADKMLEKKTLSLTNLRKVFGTIGATGPAVGVILASYAGCDRTSVAVLFTIGMGLMGFCYASLRVNALDLSPNFAGTIMALANGLGSISGMVAPNLVGFLTPHRTLSEWRVVFWVMFGVLNGTNLLFIFCGSGEVQPWNEPKLASEITMNGRLED